MGPDGVVGTDDDLTSWTMGRDVTELARGRRWIATPVEPKPPIVEPARPASATVKKSSENPPAKKPAMPTTPVPPKPTGIVDLDGDGIPDTR
jgi:hypothetical protein